MKFMKRKQVYQASNVSFNPSNLAAFSYEWWQFVKVIDNKVVFNSYFYSRSTVKHQSKVRGLMCELGLGIDVIVKVRQSLHHFDTLEAVQKESDDTIRTLEALKKQARKAAYKRRKAKLQAEKEHSNGK